MVTLTANDGDPAHPFRMWGFQDGLSHPDYTNRTITVCVEQDVNVRPIYAYDWFYDGTYVIDGGWKIKVSGLVSETQIKITPATSSANWDFAGDHELDMKKTILDANGKEYTFCPMDGEILRNPWSLPMVAQIETIRFGRDQSWAGLRTFFNDSIHPTLWEISASTYEAETGPGPKARIIYFSSPSFVLRGALTGLGFIGDYWQLLRLNTKSETWRNFLDDPAKVTRWRQLPPETRALFVPSYFGLSAGYHPYGLTADGNGVFKALMWVEPDRKPGLVLMVR